MNCHEFEERWNDVLDARSEGLPEIERDLEAHASTCERCQATSARYQLLRQAVAAWGPPPVPSVASIERLRRLTVAPKSRRVVGRLVRFAIPLATAAGLLAWAGINAWRTGQVTSNGLVPRPIARIATPRPIEMTIEEATSATIDLALEASAPAARIGRDVLGLEPPADRGQARTVEVDDESAGADVTASATDLLQTVGERVNAGVKPISGSARHAFSFLLGPPPDLEKPSSSPANSF